MAMAIAGFCVRAGAWIWTGRGSTQGERGRYRGWPRSVPPAHRAARPSPPAFLPSCEGTSATPRLSAAIHPSLPRRQRKARTTGTAHRTLTIPHTTPHELSRALAEIRAEELRPEPPDPVHVVHELHLADDRRGDLERVPFGKSRGEVVRRSLAELVLVGIVVRVVLVQNGVDSKCRGTRDVLVARVVP